jgi:hypothetical protein
MCRVNRYHNNNIIIIEFRSLLFIYIWNSAVRNQLQSEHEFKTTIEQAQGQKKRKITQSCKVSYMQTKASNNMPIYKLHWQQNHIRLKE